MENINSVAQRPYIRKKATNLSKVLFQTSSITQDALNIYAPIMGKVAESTEERSTRSNR